MAPQNGILDANTHHLHRLAFMLTEFCNLACPYCYEHREPEIFYNSDPTKRTMSESSVIALLEGAFKLWPSIESLFFFGGEPLLKRKLIKFIRALEFSVADYLSQVIGIPH